RLRTVEAPGAARIHERGARHVRDETANELGADEPRGRRMRGQDVEDLFGVALAATGLDAVSEHELLAVVVHARLELEAAALPRVRNRPSRKRARDFLDVLLGVP